MSELTSEALIQEMKDLIAKLEQLSQERLELIEEAQRPPNFRGIKEKLRNP